MKDKVKRIRRCGACNQKFEHPQDLKEHLSKCESAKLMTESTDILIDVKAERSAITENEQ